MLETEIKKLREEIAALREGLQAITQGFNAVTADIKTTMGGDEPQDSNPVVTREEIKALSKEKISAGASRADIKQIIEKHGGSSLASLPNTGFSLVYGEINEL